MFVRTMYSLVRTWNVQISLWCASLEWGQSSKQGTPLLTRFAIPGSLATPDSDSGLFVEFAIPENPSVKGI